MVFQRSWVIKRQISVLLRRTLFHQLLEAFFVVFASPRSDSRENAEDATSTRVGKALEPLSALADALPAIVNTNAISKVMQNSHVAAFLA
jgi:hypothetical protein